MKALPGTPVCVQKLNIARSFEKHCSFKNISHLRGRFGPDPIESKYFEMEDPTLAVVVMMEEVVGGAEAAPALPAAPAAL